jgi:hypothetical protein
LAVHRFIIDLSNIGKYKKNFRVHWQKKAHLCGWLKIELKKCALGKIKNTEGSAMSVCSSKYEQGRDA